MTTQEQPSKTRYDHAQDFVTDVLRLCEDPGKRAALRSGLGRPMDRCQRMHQAIAWRVPRGRDSSERAYYAVAAMIASLPPQARGAGGPSQRNFGTCLAEGVGRVLREQAVEARLSLLTRQSVDGVHRHLPSAVRVLSDRPSAVDWAQLLLDLCDWEDYRDQVTRRWLQSFYRTRYAAEREAAQAADGEEHDSE
ncbi:type I-E CRISPR-associated protein Cse2/CasB [Actinomadura xylanilytica]|uniref:type I-E CRISPR-associated protein Cse2/CasB n=1 Tax=Actinomadura xylanilytica TaxID=887459 RepID=UPI00255A9F48|nr:type I-E CRISPR-associated protein Cse2/CasB [Actinomadura xylanilytica]MDL4770749.1 type I-E CRISPR-associated protein Cse2/CasB [Actinomadura xylanilytica]